MSLPELSKNHLKELAKLRIKKYRLASGKVVIDGSRILEQLFAYGIQPLEQYVAERAKPQWENVIAYSTTRQALERICTSEQPQAVAALFKLPRQSLVTFRRAFYLDGISDPGNLGTIFRTAAAFGIGQILLSPDCVEATSPKVIKASLGSVFRVPFQIMPPVDLATLNATLVGTDARRGTPLHHFHPSPQEKLIILIGNEAHGIDPVLKRQAKLWLSIGISQEMESLNAAVASAIIAHHLYVSEEVGDSG